jgi:hypothetical protein
MTGRLRLILARAPDSSASATQAPSLLLIRESRVGTGIRRLLKNRVLRDAALKTIERQVEKQERKK